MATTEWRTYADDPNIEQQLPTPAGDDRLDVEMSSAKGGIIDTSMDRAEGQRNELP